MDQKMHPCRVAGGGPRWQVAGLSIQPPNRFSHPFQVAGLPMEFSTRTSTQPLMQPSIQILI